MGTIQDRFRTKRNIVIAVLGLDGAGKSTFIQVMTEDNVTDDQAPLPTVGYSTRTLAVDRYNILLTEVGGGKNIRGIWPKYFAQCHALIYMVDGTSDRDRLNESKEELRNILLDKRMKCKPLLVLCNKYDTRECIGPNSLIDAFSLSQMLLDSLDNGENVTGMSEPKVRVWVCTCLRGRRRRRDPKLYQSLKWLLKQITEQWQTLSRRVEEQHNVELQQKEVERLERIRKRKERLEEEERLERQKEIQSECISNRQSSNIITVVAEIENRSPHQEETIVEGCSRQDSNVINAPNNEGATSSVLLESTLSSSLSSPLNNQLSPLLAGKDLNSSKKRKTAKIVRRLKGRNKLVPINQDSFVSQPPLLLPWNTPELSLPSDNTKQNYISDEIDSQTNNNMSTQGKICLPAITNHPVSKVTFNLPQDVLLTLPIEH